MTVTSPDDPMLVFANPGYDALQQELTAALHAEMGQVQRDVFPDGERYQRIVTSVEGRDVVLVGGTVDDESTLSLYDLACGLVEQGARRLSLVIPYFGYSTMERAVRTGEVVTANPRLCQRFRQPAMGIGSMVDLHSEGFLTISNRGFAQFTYTRRRSSVP